MTYAEFAAWADAASVGDRLMYTELPGGPPNFGFEPGEMDAVKISLQQRGLSLVQSVDEYLLVIANPEPAA